MAKLMTPPIKAVFDSDVLNDENHLYIPNPGIEGRFALLGFELYEGISIKHSLRDAYRYFIERGFLPRIVFIPLKHYTQEVSEQAEEEVLGGITFADVCKDLGVEFIVMIPNSLKGKFMV